MTELDVAKASIQSLQRQLEEARVALRPFGLVGANLPAMSGDPCHEVIGRDGIRRAITDADFRLAASTLGRLEGGGSSNAISGPTPKSADTEAEPSAEVKP